MLAESAGCSDCGDRRLAGAALDIPGGHLVTSSWEVLSGEARVAGEVLLLDEVGDHAALVCADVMARMGCAVTLATPDRMAGHDLGPTNSAVVLRDLALQGVVFESLLEPVSVAAEGNRKRITLRHVLSGEDAGAGGGSCESRSTGSPRRRICTTH